ncbi:MAG: hypothetical protein EP329_07690 [Deltaproteobacteria bacterium]|nr:MAG: hypothetical protein EP329_07690 [Deltaproteobacteria bacterium]
MLNPTARLASAAVLLLSLGSPALAAPDATAGAAPVAADEPAAASLSARFTWRDDATGASLKPVLQIGTTVLGYYPESEANPDLAERSSTLVLMRFGLEGRALGVFRFRTVWERNLGYNVNRNGPLGTSIWEGTASLSTRETFLELSKWGVTLTAGIFTEPGSVDFISENSLDMFGMDPFVRDPLLQSGFNLGQGVMLRYDLAGFSLGVSYTGGNPLVSSLSGSFGGDVTAAGSLYDAPLRDLSSGLPGSNISVDIVSPSLTWSHDFGPVAVAARAAAQYYFVDVDVTQSADQPLDGFNYRFSAEATLLDDHLRLFGGYSRRGNRQLAVPDLTRYKDDFQGRVWNLGFDVRYDRFGLGGSLHGVRRLFGDNTAVDTKYLNVGATYWIIPDSVSAGLRYASIAWDKVNVTRSYTDAKTIIASLRLLL